MMLSQLHRLYGIAEKNDCELWTGKDLEGNSRNIFKELYWNLPSETEEEHEKPQWGQPSFKMGFR